MVRTLPPLNAHDVAAFFLSVVDRENGDTMTHLRLEKLAYYGQAWHLALTGAALFPEPVEAWELGPVVRALYDKYKEYDAQPIPPPAEPSIPAGRVGAVLAQVWSTYGRFSAGELSRMTHEEEPWKAAWARRSRMNPSPVIRPENMLDYFRRQLERAKQRREVEYAVEYRIRPETDEEHDLAEYSTSLARALA